MLTTLKPFYLLLLSLLGGSASIVAQQLAPAIQWSKCLGGTGDDRGLDIIKAIDNGFVVVGSTKSNNGDVTAHYGSTDSTDAWVVKLSSAGDIEWQKNFGGDGVDVFKSIIRTNDDHYICFGTTTSNNGDVSGNHGRSDIWVMKIDRHGNIVWQKCYGGSVQEVAGNISKNADGSFYFIGSTSSSDGDVSNKPPASREDIWVVKIGATGNLEYQKCWSGTQPDNGFDILEAPGEGYYFVGETQSTNGDFSNFGGNTPLPVIIKTDGNTVLYKAITPQRSTTFSIIPSGQYKFNVGTSSMRCYPTDVNTSVAIGEITFPPNLQGSPSVTTLINLEGCYTYNGYAGPWHHPGGPHSQIMINATENISVVTYDATSIFPNLPSPNGGADGLISGFNTGGVTSWKKFIGGSQNDILSSVVQDEGFDFLVAGSTGSNDGDVTGNHGGGDVWVVKLGKVNVVKGTVFADYNSNGIKDAGEHFVNDLLVQTQKGSLQSGSITRNGTFSNYVDTGNFTTQIATAIPYHAVVSALHASAFTTYNNQDSFSFAIQPLPGKRDYEVSLGNITFTRPGFPTWYSLVVRNLGTDTLTNRTVTLIIDSRLSFVNASTAPSSISGDTLRWVIASVPPRDRFFVEVQFSTPAPPDLEIADTVQAFAMVDTTGDLVHANNFDYLLTTVRGSFDPNDKLESHSGTLFTTDLAAGKPLVYTIRFQNTGTDTTFNVTIRDTLDANTDWSSIEMVGSSHTYQFTVTDGRYCTWKFNNILLPDSNVNEPLSHGYITFRIKPKVGLTVGDQVKNSAAIYFDFNLPVITNSEITEIKPPPPSQPVITGLQANYCNTTGVTTVKITNLPATGSGITVTVKIDANTVGVEADSTFNFNVSTLAAGAHTISVQYSNTSGNRINSAGFTVTEAVTPDVNVLASIINILDLRVPVVITATNAAGGGTGPLYTFAKDRNFTNIWQAESVNNTWTFNASVLAIGDNMIYIRMKSNASCVVANTATDSVLLKRSSVTGINDPDLPGQVISIYPNPFRDVIMIKGLSAAKTYIVTLYNLEGKRIVSRRVSNRSTLNITRQHQATGTYWLSIYDEKRKQLLGTVKLLKQ